MSDGAHEVRRICVTGPECSGKTTLAEWLGSWLGTESVPEAARLYATRVARPLTVADYMPIAREHVALADAAMERVRGSRRHAVVLDTDLLSTIVYAQHYYGETTEWLQREVCERLADLYLLCDVDIPWVPDGVRDRPTLRKEMFALFDAELERQRANVIIVRGDAEGRWEGAVAAIIAAGLAP